MRGFLILVLAVLGGCGGGLRRFEFTQLHMGVEARVVLYAADEESAAAAAGAGFARIAELDGILTDYRTDSELMRLSAAAGGEAVVVGPDLYRVLKRSLEVYRASEGVFDVTIGPVVRLWREARKTGRMPGEPELAAARALVGSRDLELDPRARTARLARAGMMLDAGGIGKGYAAAEALEVLRARGCGRALVALAGDVALGDPPPGRTGWRVAVAPLVSGGGGMAELHGVSVSTSGDAEQFVEIEGVRYSHIINPGTGRGATGSSQITVIARDGALADGLATAASLMEAGAAVAMVGRVAGASVYIQRGGGTGAAVVASPGFPVLKGAR